MSEIATIGDATDYANPDNWYKCLTGDQITEDVDVIYLVPSACFNPESGKVCPVDDESLHAFGAGYYNQQASCFEGIANVYFPWWRQVNGALLPTMSFEEVNDLAMGAPRTDIYAALDYYFENLNDGRPYMFAGHSQGSRMMSLVLAEYMQEHPELYSRMICAYMLGDGLTREYLEANPNVKAAQAADDLGVVVSWNTEGPENLNAASLVVPPNCVCINPLNWRTDDELAPASANLGCMVPDMVNGTASPAPGIADAQINLDRGSVIVTEKACAPYTVRELLGPDFDAVFGPQSYHLCDYGFFYDNIRENARTRIARWFEAHA